MPWCAEIVQKAQPPKQTSVQVDRVADHLVCRDDATLGIFGMWQASIGQVERSVNLFCGKGWQGRIDDKSLVSNVLNQPCCMFFVRFLFDMLEIGGVFFLVFQADLMRDKFDGLALEVGERSLFVLQEESLLNVSQFADSLAVLDGFGNFHHGELAHTVHAEVGF